MDQIVKEAAENGVAWWGNLGAFAAGALGLRGAQWWSGRGQPDAMVDELRKLRYSIEAQGRETHALLEAMGRDIILLKDRSER